MVYSTDRSKIFVALWFILRGDLFYVLPCVILFVHTLQQNPKLISFCFQVKDLQNKTFLTYQSAHYSVFRTTAIHFNGNVFGSKCCRGNESSLYFTVKIFVIIEFAA